MSALREGIIFIYVGPIYRTTRPPAQLLDHGHDWGGSEILLEAIRFESEHELMTDHRPVVVLQIDGQLRFSSSPNNLVDSWRKSDVDLQVAVDC